MRSACRAGAAHTHLWAKNVRRREARAEHRHMQAQSTAHRRLPAITSRTMLSASSWARSATRSECRPGRHAPPPSRRPRPRGKLPGAAEGFGTHPPCFRDTRCGTRRPGSVDTCPAARRSPRLRCGSACLLSGSLLAYFQMPSFASRPAPGRGARSGQPSVAVVAVLLTVLGGGGVDVARAQVAPGAWQLPARYLLAAVPSLSTVLPACADSRGTQLRPPRRRPC